VVIDPRTVKPGGQNHRGARVAQGLVEIGRFLFFYIVKRGGVQLGPVFIPNTIEVADDCVGVQSGL